MWHYKGFCTYLSHHAPQNKRLVPDNRQNQHGRQLNTVYIWGTVLKRWLLITLASKWKIHAVQQTLLLNLMRKHDIALNTHWHLHFFYINHKIISVCIYTTLLLNSWIWLVQTCWLTFYNSSSDTSSGCKVSINALT